MAFHSLLSKLTKKSRNYTKKPIGLFIIGNGFDQDLQRNITYREFYNSEFWPHGDIRQCSLCKFLETALPRDYWYNLEEAISDYVDATKNNDRANNNDEKMVAKDIQFYNHLVEGMAQYASSKSIQSLYAIQQHKGKMHKHVPLAYQVFETIMTNPLYRIYSFNYTELNSIAQLVLENNKIKQTNMIENKFEYVHGSLEMHDIILGAKDCQTIKGYEIIQKTQQLKANHLVAELATANQVVIFGHSLSSIDRCYYDDFFMQIKTGKSPCHSVLIITYNDISMSEIKHNLKEFYDLDWKCPIIEYFKSTDYEKLI